MIKSDFGMVEMQGEFALIMSELTSIIKAIKQIHEQNGFSEEMTKKSIMHSVDMAFMNSEQLKASNEKMIDELKQKMNEGFGDFFDRLLKDIFEK